MCYTIFQELYYSKQRVVGMKQILTIGIVWSLLITAVIAHGQIPAERLEEALALTPEQQEKKY